MVTSEASPFAAARPARSQSACSQSARTSYKLWLQRITLPPARLNAYRLSTHFFWKYMSPTAKTSG